MSEEIKRIEELDINTNIKSERFTELNTIEELDNCEFKEEEFIPSFEDLIKTGQIGPDTFLFFDYNRERYIYLNEKTGDKQVLGTTAASYKLFDIFLAYDIKLKNPASDLKYVKKVNVEFDVMKPKFWETGLGTHYNEFDINKTQIGKIRRERRKLLNLPNRVIFTQKLTYLKMSCPALYSLFDNLFENDDEAIKHFINWIVSFIMTGKKIPTAFMFSSLEGSGKGVLSDIVMNYLFGNDYSTSQMAEKLGESFNGFLENKLFINFNEVSSDFSKKDTTTQRLKSLITDNEFNLNVKYQKDFDAKNNFLIMLSQNNLNGVKISLTDRRFNYFVPQRTLKSIAENDFNMSIREFVETKIKSELEYFVNFLAAFDYDLSKANDLYETESKKRSQLATSNPSEFLFSLIKNKDIETINREFLDMVEMYDTSDSKQKYDDKYVSFIFNKTEILERIELSFERNFISNVDLTALYTVLVDDNGITSDRVIKKIMDSQLGKSVSKSIKGKTFRGKDLSSIEDTENEEDLDF